MCDTLVATGKATKDGVAILAKNSDRYVNEAQYLLRVPAEKHQPRSKVRCTYIEIPQVMETHALLLSKPYWIWGAEMGINEHGLAIGNEAIFSKVPSPRKKALIGMDLLRLGLERADSARQAVSVITELLDRYGQGGNCGNKNPEYYHNSFLMADPQESWVLETVGRNWAARQVEGVYTISNGLSIAGEWDLASDELVEEAIRQGWCRNREEFSFSGCYSDFLYTRFSDSRHRRSCSTKFLGRHKGAISVQTAIAALRDHGEERAGAYRPEKSLLRWSVCAHASNDLVRTGQTTASLVAYLHPRRAMIFVTGSAAPCTSLFKPAWVDLPLPDTGPVPSNVYDPKSLFWQHERLHRATLRDYSTRLQSYAEERDALEARFVGGGLERVGEPDSMRAPFEEQCFREAARAEEEWLARVSGMKIVRKPGWSYRQLWGNANREARLPRERRAG